MRMQGAGKRPCCDAHPGCRQEALLQCACRVLIENKSKVLLAPASSAYKHALQVGFSIAACDGGANSCHVWHACAHSQLCPFQLNLDSS